MTFCAFHNESTTVTFPSLFCIRAELDKDGFCKYLNRISDTPGRMTPALLVPHPDELPKTAHLTKSPLAFTALKLLPVTYTLV